VGEAEEGLVGELDVPFGTLPSLGGVPPLPGKEIGALGLSDRAFVGAGEEGKGVGMASV
jgi:hypothetical protein